MTIDSGCPETTNNNMETDEIAALLVKLYADYVMGDGGYHHEDYAKAIAIAIRMLND